MIRLFPAPCLFARGIVGQEARDGVQAGVVLQSDIIKVFLAPPCRPCARHVYL